MALKIVKAEAFSEVTEPRSAIKGFFLSLAVASVVTFAALVLDVDDFFLWVLFIGLLLGIFFVYKSKPAETIKFDYIRETVISSVGTCPLHDIRGYDVVHTASGYAFFFSFDNDRKVQISPFRSTPELANGLKQFFDEFVEEGRQVSEQVARGELRAD